MNMNNGPLKGFVMCHYFWRGYSFLPHETDVTPVKRT